MIEVDLRCGSQGKMNQLTWPQYSYGGNIVFSKSSQKAGCLERSGREFFPGDGKYASQSWILWSPGWCGKNKSKYEC